MEIEYVRSRFIKHFDGKTGNIYHSPGRINLIGEHTDYNGGFVFPGAVEQGIMAHTIAAHFRTDPIHTRELRAYAVDEVKRTNGQVSFESAVRSQRRIEPDDTWPGSY